MASYLTATTGQTISAAFGNNARDGIICTGSSPTSVVTSPFTGQAFSQTSNNTSEGIYVRNSAGNWRQPWNLPWGSVTEVTLTANLTFATGSNIAFYATILSLPSGGGVFSPSNRRLQFTFGVTQFTTTGTGQSNMQLWTNRDGQLADLMIAPAGSAAGTYPGGELSVTYTMGTQGIFVQGYLFTSATTLQLQAGAVAPSYIRVEDIGPAGVPT
jgi:hypothetical protein